MKLKVFIDKVVYHVYTEINCYNCFDCYWRLGMRIELLPVDEVKLDLNNPRIARILDMYKDKDSLPPEAIALALGSDSYDSSNGETYTSYRALRESIKMNGGIIQPIIVNYTNQNGYIVIEGNTRLQIYKDFKSKNVPGDWDHIPANVNDNLTPEEIDAIRLQSHLVGPRPWDPYSKAKYLHYLSKVELMSMNRIIDFCGGKAKDVNNYIAAFEDMEEYFKPLYDDPSEFEQRKFSAFVELQNDSVVNGLLRVKCDKSDFAKWVKEDLFQPLNTIRQFPRIAKSQEAFQIFLHDGAKAAITKLDVIENSFDLSGLSIFALAKEITNRILKMEYQEFMFLRNNKESEEYSILMTTKADLEEFLEEVER